MQELDRLDRKILAIVQKDAARSSEAIAAAVGLSPSAVQRRLARMRQSGVIVAEVAVVDPRSLGCGLTLIADIEVEQDRPEKQVDLRRWIEAEDAVQEAWSVTGATDYSLIVQVGSIDAYEALMQRFMADNPTVRRYHTRVTLGTLKRGQAVPIPEDGGV